MGNKKQLDEEKDSEVLEDSVIKPNNETDELTELFESENQNSEKYRILEELIDTSKNLAVKTIIEKPILYTSLKILTDVAIQYKLPITAQILINLGVYSSEFNISKNGLGREQIIRAISNIGEDYRERNDTNIQKEDVN